MSERGIAMETQPHTLACPIHRTLLNNQSSVYYLLMSVPLTVRNTEARQLEHWVLRLHFSARENDDWVRGLELAP